MHKKSGDLRKGWRDRDQANGDVLLSTEGDSARWKGNARITEGGVAGSLVLTLVTAHKEREALYRTAVQSLQLKYQD